MDPTRSDRHAPSLAHPAAVPSLLVALASRVLPGGSKRTRYLQEFRAELYGMPVRRQTTHALRIVASSWSLRSASANPERERRTMLTVLRSKPPLCLLNLRHHWVTQSTLDGSLYERCARCGKDRRDDSIGIDLNKGMTLGF
jgi:hypothetical protein